MPLLSVDVLLMVCVRSAGSVLCIVEMLNLRPLGLMVNWKPAMSEGMVRRNV